VAMSPDRVIDEPWLEPSTRIGDPSPLASSYPAVATHAEVPAELQYVEPAVHSLLPLRSNAIPARLARASTTSACKPKTKSTVDLSKKRCGS
jgi:hypothetical protein